MEKWKAVPNEVVRQVWQCQSEECECENPIQHISPDWYQNNGTPVCQCDEDMIYLYTEVVDNSVNGEDGDLAFVKTIPKDEIPEIIKQMEKTHTFDYLFNVKSKRNWEDIHPEDLKKALLDRINSMETCEFSEACGFVETIFDNEE